MTRFKDLDRRQKGILKTGDGEKQIDGERPESNPEDPPERALGGGAQTARTQTATAARVGDPNTRCCGSLRRTAPQRQGARLCSRS